MVPQSTIKTIIIITQKEYGSTIRSSHQNSQTLKEEPAVQTKGTLEELQSSTAETGGVSTFT